MKDNRVFITGCGGMLGSAVYPYFVKRHKNVLATDKRVTEDWLHQLDVRDDSALQQIFKDYRPNLVLHLAAETDLEYCETHPDIAEDTNARATKTIAKLCQAHNSTLVYISTAGVFNGRKNGYYTEGDQPNPIMVYGRTKYKGELDAFENCSKTFVVRAGWMMGGGRKKEKKFVYKILQQISNGKKKIFAVDDLWGTPTYAYDFAMNLFHLIRSGKYGLYHMACDGQGTRLDVARELLGICRRSEIKLTPVASDYFAKDYFVVRPRSEMMKNVNLSKIGLNFMRAWKESLNEYIYDYYFDYISKPSSSQNERRKHFRKNGFDQMHFRIEGELERKIHTGCRIDKSVSGVGLLASVALKPGQSITIRDQLGNNWPVNSEMNKYKILNGEKYRIGLKSNGVQRYLVNSIYELDPIRLATYKNIFDKETS